MTATYEYRSGIGYDIHRTGGDGPLVLGGVAVPSDYGLLGHSDADVLTHAVMDALLGSIGAEDIGQHFPDTDPELEDISSLKLLARVRELLDEAGAAVVNIDVTVVAEAPKLWPFFQEMREHLADTLELDLSRINLKATSAEQTGPVGREEAVAAHAVCSVRVPAPEGAGAAAGETSAEQSGGGDGGDGSEEPLYERSEEQKEGDLALLDAAEEITAHTDGASRGNPGPASAAAVLRDPEEHALYPLWEELGEMTSNRAEYEAVIMLLKFLHEQGWEDKQIELCSDSQLLVKQISGEYRVKSDNLKDVWQTAKSLLGEFPNLELKHVSRGDNKLADRLANEVLDA